MTNNQETVESSLTSAKSSQKPLHKVEKRSELASFLCMTSKSLNYVLYGLYGKDRRSAYRAFEIKKSSGKTRVLHAVSGPLKDVQRKALDKLEEHFKPSAYAHGFVKQKSIISNAAIHRRKRRIIKVDMEDFFPSINFGRVQGMFLAPPFNFWQGSRRYNGSNGMPG